VSLGLDETDSNKANFEVYRQHFETPFIQSTAEYYALESKSFLAENSVSAYMKKAEDRLREEEDRIERYLNSTTRKVVRSCLPTQSCCMTCTRSLGLAHVEMRGEIDR
jgi:cullin 1